MKYNNPIISGFHPDPSFCRVGDDYYLVTSTFEFFPGVPIFHSKNLVNWELIGHCLNRNSQLVLDQCKPSGGIYAPTLRYHEGIFYMTTTNVSHKGNFIVHTTDIRGEWSEPVWIDQSGIDPSLLFDDDGTVYFVSTTGGEQEGKAGIQICEINPLTGEKKTKSQLLSYGCGGRYPEAPHMYKREGFYYLMLAEGGTEYGHRETILRSDNPYGPYEACPHNPILSHAEDMREDIYCTGHADILEDHNGNWWMTCLGVRPCGGKKNRVLLHNLGRETFLAPMRWTEDGWPAVGDDGLISLEMEGDLPGPTPTPICRGFKDDFLDKVWSPHYNYLRNPQPNHYVRDTAQKQLRLKGTSVTLNDMDSPTWIGVRQKGFVTKASVQVVLEKPVMGARAGLTAFYNDAYHYEIYLTKGVDGMRVALAKRVHDIFVVCAQADIPGIENVNLRIESDETYYRFYYSCEEQGDCLLGTGLVVGLCTEGTRTMTFTGTYLAMFAENTEAIFSDFCMETMD